MGSGIFLNALCGSNMRAGLNKGNQFPNHCESRWIYRWGDSDEIVSAAPPHSQGTFWELALKMFTQTNPQEPWFYAGPLQADSEGQPQPSGCLRKAPGPQQPLGLWSPEDSALTLGQINTMPPHSVIRADNGILRIVSFLKLRFTLMGEGKISPRAMRSLLLC